MKLKYTVSAYHKCLLNYQRCFIASQFKNHVETIDSQNVSGQPHQAKTG